MSSLYVSNLPQAFDENEFRKLFQPFGEIERVDIPDRHGAANLIAYVHFQDPNASSSAVASLNDVTFMGKKLKIEISTKQKRTHQPIQRSMNGAPEPPQYNVPRPRPPNTHHKSNLFPFQDPEKFYSLPCRMLPVHNAQIEPNSPNMPLNLTIPSFEREGQTYSLSTTILVNKQPTDALVFFLPLPKKNEVNEFAQNYNNPTSYPPPAGSYPPHAPIQGGQYNTLYQPPYPNQMQSIPPQSYNHPPYDNSYNPGHSVHVQTPPPGPSNSTSDAPTQSAEENSPAYNEKPQYAPDPQGADDNSSRDDSDSPSWLAK